jgi:hypothetical protein
MVAFASWSLTKAIFLTISLFSAVLIGMSFTASTFSEQKLLLKYSEKGDRDKNSARFRAAAGIAMIVAPLLFSPLYAIGKFTAVFLTVGVGSLLVVAFIYYKLYKARDEFKKEKTRNLDLLLDDEVANLLDKSTDSMP